MRQAAAEAFSVGDIRCQVVPDGTATYRRESIFGNVPAEELDPALEGQLNDEGLLPVPYNGLLVRTGEQVVLIDAGAGEEQAEEWGEPVGGLHGWLGENGIGAGDVDVVIVSHAHVDHIGGLTKSVAGGREPVFTRARHVLSADEWDYWASDEAAARSEYLAGKARKHLPVLEEAGLLDRVRGETEILPGIRLTPTPGHTPGHLSVAIDSGDEHALFTGDVFLHELNFEHPQWASALDTSPDLSIETRGTLLEAVAGERVLLVAPHLWRTGRAERGDGAYRFLPRD